MDYIGITQRLVRNDMTEGYTEKACLIESGCGCCESAVLVTPENLAQAIAEAEDYVKELKELRDKLYASPTNT